MNKKNVKGNIVRMLCSHVLGRQNSVLERIETNNVRSDAMYRTRDQVH